MIDQERIIKIELPWKTIAVISAALHELPGKVCNPIIDAMQKQIDAQTKADGKVETDNVVPIKRTRRKAPKA